MIRRERQTNLFYYVGQIAFTSLAEAQKFDLKQLMPATAAFSDAQETDGTPVWQNQLADWLLANAAIIAKILTTTPRSRNRKPRKDKGVPRVKAENVGAKEGMTTSAGASPAAPQTSSEVKP